MEEALYLTRFASKVTLIHRRAEFRGEKILQEQVRNHPKIALALDSVVDEIVGDETPHLSVTGVRVRHERRLGVGRGRFFLEERQGNRQGVGR